MADLSTNYMGLNLKNPIIVGSSELANSVEKVKRLEASGAAAVVLKSLFEEQIMMEVDAQRVNNMYGSYVEAEGYVSFYTRKHNLDEYLNLIKGAKEAVQIPVIASINCISDKEWMSFADKLVNAGADALELNMFIMPNDPKFDGRMLEQIYFDVIPKIREVSSVPVALKLSPYFSGMAHTFVELSRQDIQGMVLFNRFYSPDVDLNREEIIPRNVFSHEAEISNTLRWIGMLSDKVACDMAASNGIHTGEDVIKTLLVGAKAAQVVSTLFKNGFEYLPEMLRTIEEWMEQKGYASINDFRGKLNQANVTQPMMYERAQFMRYYSNYSDAKF
jgi:dihydroorotate dehydrogenase (fumarate)